MKKIIIILAFAVIFIVSARGQNFTNLNFESAYNLPGNPGNGESVSVTNALPGWAAYGSDGDMTLFNIYYVSNYISGAQTQIELEGGSLALSGNNLSVGLYPDGTISQTGVVPDNAEFIQFEASGIDAPVNFVLTLGGQDLSYSAISEGPDYTVYVANIPTGMDGDMEALAFLDQGEGDVLLDDIEFMPVPEPSEYGLVGLGAAALLAFRRRW